MPNQCKLTRVRSIRASDEFWEMAKNTAKEKKLDTNKLIVNVVTEYCKGENNGRK